MFSAILFFRLHVSNYLYLHQCKNGDLFFETILILNSSLPEFYRHFLRRTGKIHFAAKCFKAHEWIMAHVSCMMEQF